MRYILVAATALGLGACSMPGSNYNVAPKVSYGYGLGDNVAPTGPKPNYSFKYGMGDNTAPTGPSSTYSYGYGADGLTTDTVAMAPQTQPQTRVASPANGSTTTNTNHL